MKNLYAPWREAYATSDFEKNKKSVKTDCVFCQQLEDTKDEEYFILGRYKKNCIMLNRYPYNAGHLLIVPLEHQGWLEQLDQTTQQEMIYLVSESITILKNTLKCDGINVGLNLGEGAGGSIPAHLHFHVLPRWLGDTNFLPTLADTKQIPFNLSTLYTKLQKYFLDIKPI